MELFIVLSYYLYYFTVAVLLKVHDCYETPKEERISRVFGNLIDNIKLHNGVKL